jgi:putative transposase
MLFAGMPRYTHRQTQVNGVPVDPDQPALTFEAFTAELLGWVEWWNGEHTIRELEDRTPLQSWLDDPTPVHEVDAAKLWMFTELSGQRAWRPADCAGRKVADPFATLVSVRS